MHGINHLDLFCHLSRTIPDYPGNDGFVHDFAVDFPAQITETAYDLHNPLDPIDDYHPAFCPDWSKHSAELKVVD